MYFAMALGIVAVIILYKLAGLSCAEGHHEGSSELVAAFQYCLTHCQISAIYLSINVDYPRLFLNLVELLSFIFSLNFADASTPECSVGSLGFVARWALKTVAPVVAMLPFLAMMWYFRADAKRVAQSVVTIVYLAASTYLFQMKSAMSIWLCIEAPTGEDVLFAAPDQVCSAGDAAYLGIVCGSIAVALFYFGGVNIALMRLAQKFQEVARAVQMDYRDGCQMWFAIVNVYKLVAVSSITILAINPAAQVSIMIIASSAMAALTHKYKPHKESETPEEPEEPEAGRVVGGAPPDGLVSDVPDPSHQKRLNGKHRTLLEELEEPEESETPEEPKEPKEPEELEQTNEDPKDESEQGKRPGVSDEYEPSCWFKSFKYMCCFMKCCKCCAKCCWCCCAKCICGCCYGCWTLFRDKRYARSFSNNTAEVLLYADQALFLVLALLIHLGVLRTGGQGIGTSVLLAIVYLFGLFVSVYQLRGKIKKNKGVVAGMKNDIDNAKIVHKMDMDA